MALMRYGGTHGWGQNPAGHAFLYHSCPKDHSIWTLTQVWEREKYVSKDALRNVTVCIDIGDKDKLSHVAISIALQDIFLRHCCQGVD